MKDEKPESIDGSLKAFAKGAGFVFVALVLSKGLNYLYRLFVARYLGASEYGLISIGVGIVGIILSFILLGFKTGIVRHVAFYNSKKDKPRTKGTILSAVDILFPLSLAAGILLFWFAPQIARMVLSENNLAPQLALILQIFAISLPFDAMLYVFKSATRGLQNIKYFVYGEYIVGSVAQFAAVSVLLIAGFGIIGAAVPYTFSIAVALLFMLYFFGRKIFPDFGSVKAVRNHSELFWYSIPLIIAETSNVIMSWVDTLFLGFFKTASETGIYNAASPTANIILSMSLVFGTLFFPMITDFFAKKKYREMHETYRVISKWAFSLSFPFLLLMVLFSRNILYIFFGPEYVSGHVALSILAIGYFFSVFFLTSAHVLLTLKKTRWVMLSIIVSLTMNLFLNVTLVPLYGMLGAAISSASSAFVLQFLYGIESWYFTKSTGLRFLPFSWGMLKSFAAGIMSISIVYMIAQLWEYTPVYVLGTLFLLFLSLYSIFTLLLGGLEKEDIIILKSIESKFGLRNEWLRKLIKRFMR